MINEARSERQQRTDVGSCQGSGQPTNSIDGKLHSITHLQVKGELWRKSENREGNLTKDQSLCNIMWRQIRFDTIRGLATNNIRCLFHQLCVEVNIIKPPGLFVHWGGLVWRRSSLPVSSFRHRQWTKFGSPFCG